jgi:hypothetical protein
MAALVIRMRPLRQSFPAVFRPLLALGAALLAGAAQAQQDAAPPSGALAEVPFHQLSDRQISAFAQGALEIRAADWRHAESANFVYHFFHSFIAAPVAAEAEAFYRMIAKDLEKETAQWERKCHIFVFEAPEDWAQFRRSGGLDPWTGGLHRGGELFLMRNPALKWKGDTLAHEVAHLVVHRFFGPGVPLWLNEGYAEYAASRFHAAFFRARGYAAKPRAGAVSPEQYLPLATLVGLMDYPSDPLEVRVFYAESERLARFLSGRDRAGFRVFFDAMSRGSRFESALEKGFGPRFGRLDALEREFKAYATADASAAPGG